MRRISPNSLLLGFSMLSWCVRLVWNAVSASLGLVFSSLRSCLPSCLPAGLGCCVRLLASPSLSSMLFPILSSTDKAETKKHVQIPCARICLGSTVVKLFTILWIMDKYGTSVTRSRLQKSGSTVLQKIFGRVGT